MTSLYYQPSGRVPASALPIILSYACATLPVAWIYAWSTLQAPTLARPIFTLFFSLWLGYMVQQAGVRGKVRNPAWLARASLAIGLAGWYFQWAAWLALIAHMAGQQSGDVSLAGTFVGMALHPGTLFATAMNIAEAGTWGLGEDRIAGGMLLLFWLAEFGMLMAFIRIFGRMQADHPFCEASNAWAEKVDVPRKFAFIDDPHLVAPFLEQQPSELLSVLHPWSENVSHSHASVTIHRCRGADSYLSISNLLVTVENGKSKESSTPVLMHLRLPGIDPDALINELLDAVREPCDADTIATDAPVPEELEPAVEHLNGERFEAALAIAAPYAKSALIGLRTDANRLCALASSRLGRWEAACVFWEALFENEPTAHNALQLATSAVMAGELERGTLWVERARARNAKSHALAGITIETSFMAALTQAGYMQAAMKYLDEIKKFYVALGMTDPTVLYMNQVPRFDVFLDKSAPIVRANLDAGQGRLWYMSMLPHLDERGKTELNDWMNEQAQTG